MTSPTDHLTDTHTPSGPEVVGDAADAPGTCGGAAPRGAPAACGRCPPLVVLAVLAYLPYVPVELPGVLPGRVNGPGSLQLLATCLVVGGIALSYDVLFGRTGLLSFGHALFVAAGSYLLTISLSTWALPLPLAVLVALGLSTVLALVVGAIALRVGGIAFAMVTLAFAQAASIIVMRNPGGVTGGEEGRPLDRDAVPDLLVGVANAPYRYWLALGFVVVAWVVGHRCSCGRGPGHAMAAVRENEQRAAVLGFGTYRVRLLALVVGSSLGALGGIVHALVLGGSNPHLTTSEFTLSLLVMVVLGGAGSRWGALIGGVLYTYADARLVEVSNAAVLAGPARRRAPGAVAAALHPRRLLRRRGLLRSVGPDRARRATDQEVSVQMSTTPSAFVIELPEGSLAIHDLSLGTPAADAPVVLAVHGITANGLSWRRVADELGRRHGPGAVRFLAPDLRGRGDSRSVPGPYGLGAHVDDLTSIATVFGSAPVLVGHSMGAFIAALAAARHPERFPAAVLVDGGLAFPVADDLDVDAALQSVIGPAMDRLSMRFADPAAYLGFWSSHPAMGPVLSGPGGDAARAYIEHDLVQDPTDGQWHSTCVLDAVRADGADVMADRETHAGAARRPSRTASGPSSSGPGAACSTSRRGSTTRDDWRRSTCRTACARPRSTRTTTTSSSATAGSPRSPTPSIVSSTADRAARAASVDSRGVTRRGRIRPEPGASAGAARSAARGSGRAAATTRRAVP